MLDNLEFEYEISINNDIRVSTIIKLFMIDKEINVMINHYTRYHQAFKHVKFNNITVLNKFQEFKEKLFEYIKNVQKRKWISIANQTYRFIKIEAVVLDDDKIWGKNLNLSHYMFNDFWYPE
jgi:hypothetical protein